MNHSDTDETNPVHKHMILGVVVTTIADRIITLQYFEMEANPLVESLGPMLWTILSASLIVCLLALWYTCGLHDYLLPRVLTAGLMALTGAVFILNVMTVLSV